MVARNEGLQRVQASLSGSRKTGASKRVRGTGASTGTGNGCEKTGASKQVRETGASKRVLRTGASKRVRETGTGNGRMLQVTKRLKVKGCLQKETGR